MRSVCATAGGITEPNANLITTGTVPPDWRRWRDALARIRPAVYRIVVPWAAKPRTVSPDESGPVDRPSYLAALVAGLLGAFSALLAFVVITVTDGVWRFAVLAVPVSLMVLGGVLAYRFFRRPSEGL